MLVQNKLRQMVQVNRLEAMYPPQVLQNVIAKLDRVDFRSVYTCVLPPKVQLCYLEERNGGPSRASESTARSAPLQAPPGYA